MNQNPRRVCLGKIATAHGVRGLVKVIVHADDPASLEDYGPLYTSESGDKTIKISLHNPMGKFWLAVVDGVTDRTQAEKFRNTELWLDREHLPEAEEGQYYHADLIGLTVQD
ncbi:MAG TPA: ribosome maturation factor RimM, partial [Alphaproteobacteria bacterium]